MRLSRIFLSTATATVVVSSPSVSSKEDTKIQDRRPHQQFTSLHIRPWQKQCLEKSQEGLLPKGLLYHGKNLGPRPIIILDHTIKKNTDITEAARKYEPMLSQLAWEYGAVYVPLEVEESMESEKDFITYSCQQICAVMDVLDVQWTHFLTYSYGCLVAARLAASTEFPHRIGTFTSIDTPLITRELLRNMEQRGEIAKAEKDVNIPETDLTFAKQTLLSSLEEPLPCPAAADKDVYNEYLFNPKHIFHSGGLIRNEERYIPVKFLSDMRHPMQLIVPANNGKSDVSIHKEFFGLRRPSLIKGCQRHEDLFSDESASEISGVLDTWLRRFEPDAFIAKRYEQSVKEMSQLMISAAPGATPAESAEGGDQKKKKKEKKKKG